MVAINILISVTQTPRETSDATIVFSSEGLGKDAKLLRFW